VTDEELLTWAVVVGVAVVCGLVAMVYAVAAWARRHFKDGHASR
jgi:hypothetical protein